MKKIVSNQRGASLIELLLYIGLLSIIFVTILDLLFTTLSLKQEASAQASLQPDAQLISERLTFEVQNADSISTPSGIGTSSSSLVLVTGGETHTFSLVGGNLQYQKTIGVSTTSGNLNSNQTGVSNFTAQNLGNSGGKISVRLSYTITNLKETQQGSSAKSYEIIATLR